MSEESKQVRSFPDDAELNILLDAEATEWEMHFYHGCSMRFMGHRFAQVVRRLRAENAELRAEVERLRKVVEAVDDLANAVRHLQKPIFETWIFQSLERYDAAREGK